MGTLEFFSETLKALSWPVTVVACVLILRRELAGVLARLIKVSFPGGSVEFRDALKSAKRRVEEARSELPPDNAPASTGEPAATSPTEWERLLVEADRDPRAIVLHAWRLLETELNAVCNRIDATAAHGWPAADTTLRELPRWTTLRPAVRELHDLRDLAAGTPGRLQPSDAVRYVAVAEDLARELRSLDPPGTP